MPKRKKLPKTPDYINSAPTQIVQKSNPLKSLSETPLTLSELKILDVYLSRINSHNPEKRYVRFEKGELEKLLGVSRILKEDLEQRLDSLFVAVTIRDENKPNNFTKIGLFAKAEAIQDDFGLWQVDLACTYEAMEYIFNIENLGYLRYRLKNIVDLTSRYSYILYLYFESNRFRKSWVISVYELKQMLNCTADTYNQYYRFNDLVLKKCQKELNEKTDLRFTYEPIKRGRSVVAIKFTLETLSENSLLDENYEPIALEVSEKEDKEIEYGGELANSLGISACENEFTVEEIRVIQDLVLQVKGHNRGDCCDYLIEQVHKMNLYDSREKIKNRFAYLCQMIKKDIK